eukprot:m51a1_g3421 hypothetical protein (1142) ;mRNA; f:589320-593284
MTPEPLTRIPKSVSAYSMTRGGAGDIGPPAAPPTTPTGGAPTRTPPPVPSPRTSGGGSQSPRGGLPAPQPPQPQQTQQPQQPQSPQQQPRPLQHLPRSTSMTGQHPLPPQLQPQQSPVSSRRVSDPALGLGAPPKGPAPVPAQLDVAAAAGGKPREPPASVHVQIPASVRGAEAYAAALRDLARAVAQLEARQAGNCAALLQVVRSMAREHPNRAQEIEKGVPGLTSALSAAATARKALEASAGAASPETPWVPLAYTAETTEDMLALSGIAHTVLTSIELMVEPHKAARDAPESQKPLQACRELLVAVRDCLTHPKLVEAAIRAQVGVMNAARAAAEVEAAANGQQFEWDAETEQLTTAATVRADDLRLRSARAQTVQLLSLIGSSELLLVTDFRGATNLPTDMDAPRALEQMIPAKLCTTAEFGLSVQLPVFLAKFTDCSLAAVMPLSAPEGRYEYRLLDWYQTDSCCVIENTPEPAKTLGTESSKSRDKGAKAEPPTSPSAKADLMSPPAALKAGEVSLRLAVLVTYAKDALPPLPPGWTEGKKSAKNGFTFEPLSHSQAIRPTVPRVKSVRDFKISATEKDVEELTKAYKVHKSSDFKMQYAMFGVDLEELLNYERAIFGEQPIPILVRKVLYKLISEGLEEEGKAANQGNLEKIDKCTSVHELAGLLKLFLREMPVPVIPPEAQAGFLAATTASSVEAQQAAQVAAFNQLKPANRALLREVIAFLANIAANSHVNSMSTQNLAIVIAPNMIRTTGSATDIAETNTINEAITVMIKNYWDFFEAPNAPLAYVVPPTEFISFRRKLLGHKKSVRCLSLTANKRHMWSVDSDGVFFIWDTVRCCMVDKFSQQEPCKTPLFLANVGGQMWASALDGITIYDCETRSAVDKIPKAIAMAYTTVPDRNEVWCASEGSVLIYKQESKIPGAGPSWFLAESVVPEGADSATLNFAICTAFNNRVWCGGHLKNCQGQNICVWDLVDGKYKNVAKIPTSAAKIASLTSVGENVWMTSDDGRIFVWDATTYKNISTMVAHNRAVNALGVLPDQVWSCGWDKTIRVWDPVSFQCIGEILGYHNDTVGGFMACTDPSTGLYNIWASSHDKTLSVWYVRPLPAAAQARRHLRLTPSIDQNKLRSGSFSLH